MFKAIILSKLGRKEEALKSYNKMIQINPKEAKAYYNRGYSNQNYSSHFT